MFMTLGDGGQWKFHNFLEENHQKSPSEFLLPMHGWEAVDAVAVRARHLRMRIAH